IGILTLIIIQILAHGIEINLLMFPENLAQEWPAQVQVFQNAVTIDFQAGFPCLLPVGWQYIFTRVGWQLPGGIQILAGVPLPLVLAVKFLQAGARLEEGLPAIFGVGTVR